MTDSELLGIGELLIATMTIGPRSKRPWPTDNRPFAFAIDARKEEGSKIASKFYIADGPCGRWSPQFRDMLSLLHAAGLIEYGSQSCNWFMLRVGARFAGHEFAKHTPEERKDAEELIIAWGARI
jgi:hypothetical protein